MFHKTAAVAPAASVLQSVSSLEKCTADTLGYFDTQLLITKTIIVICESL